MALPVARPSKRTVKIAVAAIVVILVLFAGWKIVRVYQHVAQAQAAITNIQHLAASGRSLNLEELDLRAAHADLSRLDDAVSGLQTETRLILPLLRYFGWVPGIGAELAAAPDLLILAHGVTSGGRALADAVAPAMESAARANPHGEETLTEHLLNYLVAAEPDLIAASQRLKLAQEARERLRAQALSPRVTRYLDQLGQGLPLLSAGVSLGQIAPAALGVDGPRTYLVLAQNNHELRATGGFISGVGEVRVNAGRIEEVAFVDSYAVDDRTKPHPPAPPALERYMQAEILVMRDANWSPDFPTTARVASQIYAINRGVTVDGVIALDLEVVRLLVGALGSVEVEGVSGPVTAANVIDKMKAAWEAPAAVDTTVAELEERGQWWRHRKDFMGSLVEAALVRLQSGQEISPLALARALHDGLQGRHLLLYMREPSVQTRLETLGWDGAVRRPSPHSDFLGIVDSNVGFNKVNAAVELDIEYHVHLAADEPFVELSLTYTHPLQAPVDACVLSTVYGDAYDDMIHQCFWNYIRVYVPVGSHWQYAEGFQPDTLEVEAGEGDTDVFSGLLILPPGESATVRLSYFLPPAVWDAQPYQLRVMKQAGASPWSLTLRMDEHPPRTVELARDIDLIWEEERWTKQ